MLRIRNIHAGYRNKEVIRDLSVEIGQGEFCTILGPNGAGKSTLLKLLVKFLEIQSGTIFVGQTPLEEFSHKELARKISIIPQNFQLQFDYSVLDLVLMGRFPYSERMIGYSRQDLRSVESILEELDLIKFRHKLFSELSGGEQQRVSIARALAQETDIILMDEAFSNLDINHQIEIMQLLGRINEDQDKTIIIVSHNINLSADYSRRIIMMKAGKIIADGEPAEVITENNLKKLYQTELRIIENPVTGKPNIIYPGKK